MALGIQTPLRPFVTLQPVLTDGRQLQSLPGKQHLYKIPYNYLQRFSVSYDKSAVGDVTLELFDIEYNDIINTLVEMFHQQQYSSGINFLIQFGWDDIETPIYSTGKNISDYVGDYKNRLTGRQQSSVNSDPSMNGIISLPHIVNFLDIRMDLTSMGTHLKLSGHNNGTYSETIFLYITQIYKGTAWDIIEQILAENNFRLLWHIDKQNITNLNATTGNRHPTGKQLMGDVLQNLLDVMTYNDQAGQLYFYIDNYYEDASDVMKPRIVIASTQTELQHKIFLGNFDYFYGRESNIIGNLSIELDNVHDFFTTDQKDKVQDSQTKKTTKDTKQYIVNLGSKNVYQINSGVRVKVGTTETTNVHLKANSETRYEGANSVKPKKGTIGSVTGSEFPGRFLKSQEMQDIKQAVEHQINQFTFNATMSIMGCPNLGHQHIGMNSFLQLNVHRHDGQPIDMLSGTYSVDKVSHEISGTNFITNLQMVKSQISRETEMTAQRTYNEVGV